MMTASAIESCHQFVSFSPLYAPEDPLAFKVDGTTSTAAMRKLGDNLLTFA
jgi:hypothetical protein